MRQFFAALADAGRNAVKHASALMVFQVSPRGQQAGSFSGLHGCIDIASGGGVQAGYGAAVVRVFGGVFGSAGVAPFACDECLKFVRHKDLRW